MWLVTLDIPQIGSAEMPEAKPTDAELLAIQACLDALRPLSDDARSRVIAYLTDRFAAEAAASNGNTTS
jgi:hypothetical protein